MSESLQIETADALQIDLSVVALISMLHETPHRNSATRLFRGEPVLTWTLRRLQRSQHIGNIAILCWEDQLPVVEEIAEECHAYVLAKGPRQALATVELTAASRRWSDGWRGGIGQTCDFDRGFFAPWSVEVCEKLEADSLLLVDPAAALLDAQLIDDLIAHAAKTDSVECAFTAAAPGLVGPVVRRALLKKLVQSIAAPGRLLHYMPDQPVRDPLGTDSCLPAPTRIARSPHSFLLDSDRQVRRITAASKSLNGSLAKSSAEQLIDRLDWPNGVDPLPREIVIELNTNRRSTPIFLPRAERSAAPIQTWKNLFDEAGVCDDLRLTIAGVGDPLESDRLFDVIDAAKRAGIDAIHVVTDLLTNDIDRVRKLATSAIDIVSIHLPAMSSETYTAVMGIDGYQTALENLAEFVRCRHGAARGVPMVAPTFTKLATNLAEMEAWYDQWIRAVGAAVIVGPSDCAGQIADLSTADMSPARRSPCRRINSRMSVLCDGSIVACEQDVFGKAPLAKVGDAPLAEIWRKHFQPLREDHRLAQLSSRLLCLKCREWDRP